jgi:DNA-binding transcriptional LysR family regulator
MARSLVPSPIDLRLLQVFLAVSDSGNMTGAAQQLGLTQSAVSQSLRQLESELKVSLFTREQRPLQLTAAGNLLRERAARLLDQAHQLPHLLQEIGSTILPEIRIGLVDSIAATIGPYLIRELLQGVVHLSVYAGVAPFHADALQKRTVDFIISNDPLYDVDSLERYPIMREPFILIMPTSMAAATKGLSLDEIAAHHPLIRYSSRSHQGSQVERHLRRRAVHAPKTVEIDTSETLVAMVAAGCGWAITTPLCYWQGRAHATATVPVRLPGPGFSRSVALIARAGEFAELPRKVAQQAQRILNAIILPELKRLVPWLANELTVGDTSPGTATPPSAAG